MESSDEIEVRFGHITEKEFQHLLNIKSNKEEQSNTIVIEQNNKYYEGNFKNNNIKNIKRKNKKTYKTDYWGNIKIASSKEEISNLNIPKYYYEVVFDKPGGLVMPIIIDIEYEDGTEERRKYPAQVWRKNDSEVRKVLTSDKKIVSIKLDPDEETADIDTSNNSWPKVENESDFDKFKSQIKG